MEKHTSHVEAKEKELEGKVLSEYSKEEVQKHLEYLTSMIRRAGTEEELKAAKYIKEKLDEYGVDSEIYEFDAYIYHPGEGELQIISPLQKSLFCLPSIFVLPTPPEGMEADLISVGKGLEEDYQGVDAKGKIVLVEPEGMEEQLEAATIGEKKGVAAQIHITRGQPRTVNIGQFRNTWGNPTPETIHLLPKTPALSVCSEDGYYLRELIEKGHVKLRLKVDSWRGYKKIRLPVGALEGTREPKKYVLVAGHYCSWFIGATDNAVANSLMLEMARIFSKHRTSLARGVKFAWWTGHEQGLYAGSTWYLDNFWEDIRDNAVAYLVMDGFGRAGASRYETRNTEEIRMFEEGVVKELLGLEVKSKRVAKIGDQTFWGIGLPSIMGKTAFMPDPRVAVQGVWYSHTDEDTLDKVDIEAAAVEFRVYSACILRLCNSLVLPFEFVTMAETFKRGLEDLQNKTKSALDLTPLMVKVEDLKKKADGLNKAIGKTLMALKGKKKNIQAINACLMELSRILLPALSTRVGKYGQDPMGTKFKPIPALQSLEKLSSMASDSEEYKALHTFLLRERNKLSDVFDSANRILSDTLNRI